MGKTSSSGIYKEGHLLQLHFQSFKLLRRLIGRDFVLEAYGMAAELPPEVRGTATSLILEFPP